VVTKDEATLRLRRQRRLRDLRSIAAVLAGFATLWIALMVIGTSGGPAAASALFVSVLLFLDWVVVDGYRAARRRGKDVLASLGQGFKEAAGIFFSLS
jgi:hypothetical protein